MAQTKIGMLYGLYTQNPELSNTEAAEMLNVSGTMVRTMKLRLKQNGYIQVEDSGKVSIIRPYHENGASSNSVYKAQVYLEMVDSYMADFRQQTTFNDRLAVGRETRLILEKL